MSKIDFKPPVGGTGVFSFVPPATNTDRTITLPDAAGALHVSGAANNHVVMPTVNGVPIVESGSNSDGGWVKWADGTQHCTMYGDTSPGSGAYEWSLPMPLPFIAGFGVNIMSALHRGSSSSLQAHMTSTRSIAMETVNPRVTVWISNSFFHQCSVLVTGRWK